MGTTSMGDGREEREERGDGKGERQGKEIPPSQGE